LTADNQPANLAEVLKAGEVKKGEEAKPEAGPTKKKLKEQFIVQQERRLADTGK
jgi:hypothetical protein